MASQISLHPLKKAIDSLEEILEKPLAPSKEGKFIRDGAIQRFEYTYELSWKLLRRVLIEFYGIHRSLTIKDLFREAGKHGLISVVEKWFQYHEVRNLTVHMYAEEVAEKTYQAAQKFLPDVKQLLLKLEEVIAHDSD